MTDRNREGNVLKAQLKALESRPGRQIYLLLKKTRDKTPDKWLTQKEISDKAEVDQAVVSEQLIKQIDVGLVEVKREVGAQKYYRATDAEILWIPNVRKDELPPELRKKAFDTIETLENDLPFLYESR